MPLAALDGSVRRPSDRPTVRVMPSAQHDPTNVISVVIPMRNAARTITAQLEALAAQDYADEWEVIIADNGSSDGSAELAMKFVGRLPGLRVIDASARRGVSHARNVGARAAAGEVIALCDADDVVGPGWLTALAAACRTWDVVGGSLDEVSLNDADARAWRGTARSDAPTTSSRRYAVGCNCAVRASVVREIGGWNEDYVGGGDDVEFSWRAQLAGYSLGFAPEAVVSRRFRTDVRSLARQAVERGRAQPRHYRDFPDPGRPPRPGRLGLRRWLWLARHLGDVFASRARRGHWVRFAAGCVGRIVGSVQCRVAYL
jgi:GT2 family glycosyltransferase